MEKLRNFPLILIIGTVLADCGIDEAENETEQAVEATEQSVEESASKND